MEGKESEYPHYLQSLQQKEQVFFFLLGMRNMSKWANKQQGIETSRHINNKARLVD